MVYNFLFGASDRVGIISFFHKTDSLRKGQAGGGDLTEGRREVFNG